MPEHITNCRTCEKEDWFDEEDHGVNAEVHCDECEKDYENMIGRCIHEDTGIGCPDDMLFEGCRKWYPTDPEGSTADVTNTVCGKCPEGWMLLTQKSGWMFLTRSH